LVAFLVDLELGVSPVPSVFLALSDFFVVASSFFFAAASVFAWEVPDISLGGVALAVVSLEEVFGAAGTEADGSGFTGSTAEGAAGVRDAAAAGVVAVAGLRGGEVLGAAAAAGVVPIAAGDKLGLGAVVVVEELTPVVVEPVDIFTSALKRGALTP
jgi:hypothetical protein